MGRARGSLSGIQDKIPSGVGSFSDHSSETHKGKEEGTGRVISHALQEHRRWIIRALSRV